MDEELKELERQFEAAQQAKPATRLSERSVVDLVLKLQELGLLDADLLQTVSGRDYITQERLRQEIEAEVDKLGRITLIQLASTLDVDSYHVERQIKQLVASKPGLSLIEGEIITNRYWDRLAEEVNETLGKANQVSIGELARRFNLSAELVTGVLSSRMGTIVHGTLEAGQLYTREYVSTVKAAVRGAMRALTVPTFVPGLWSSLETDLRGRDDGGNSAAAGGLFSTVLSELIAEAAIKGSLRNGGTKWIPAVFSETQRANIEDFFSQNSYISYNALKKLDIPHPREYLLTAYPEAVALETVFVHANLVTLVDSAAEEAIRQGSWFDATLCDDVPPVFSTSDAGQLLSMCSSVQNAIKESTARCVAETCIVTNTFVEALLERLQTMLKETSTQNSVSQTKQTKQDMYEDKKQPRKKNERRHNLKDDIVEEESGKSRKSKKKPGKSKGGATKDVSSAEDANVPPEDVLAGKIVEWYPLMETAGTEDGSMGALPKALAKELRSQLVAFFVSLRHASINANADERRKRWSELQQKLKEVYGDFQVFCRGLKIFDDNKSLQVVLQKHLLRTTGVQIADMFLEAEFIDSKNGKEFPQEMSSAVRMAMAKDTSPTILKVVEALEGNDVSVFENHLNSAASEIGLRLQKLTEKSVEEYIQTYCKNLSIQIEEETDAILFLPKVIALLFVQKLNVAFQIPGRAVSSLVSYLQGYLGEDVYKILQEYQIEVKSLIQLNDEEESKKEDHLRSLQDLMIMLKSAIKSILN